MAPGAPPPAWKRRLRFTREGKYFLGITLGVGLAAINTGNNLLYLLLGMLLALMLVSGVLSELALRDLRVSRKLPSRAHAGRAHLVEIEVRNDKKRMPSYAIEVEDLRAGQPTDKRCFFLKVNTGASQVAAYRRTPSRRGLEVYTGFRVATRFPFGFFEKSRELQAPGELLVYPAVEALRLGPPPSAPEGSEGAVSAPRGGGDEPLGLRVLRDGDDPRDIYWKRRALDGQLLLRERAQQAAARSELWLDDRGGSVVPVGTPLPRGAAAEGASRKAASEATLATFERSVRVVASRAVALVRRGDHVLLRTASGAKLEASPGTGADPLLRYLALVQLKGSAETLEATEGRKVPEKHPSLVSPPPAEHGL